MGEVSVNWLSFPLNISNIARIVASVNNCQQTHMSYLRLEWRRRKIPVVTMVVFLQLSYYTSYLFSCLLFVITLNDLFSSLLLLSARATDQSTFNHHYLCFSLYITVISVLVAFIWYHWGNLRPRVHRY
jgi:hypothetical protein